MYDKPVEEVNVSLKIPRFILDELDKQADAHDVSRSFMICSIINHTIFDDEEYDCGDELIDLISDVADYLAENARDTSVLIQPEGFQFFTTGETFVRNCHADPEDSDDCDCDCDCEM